MQRFLDENFRTPSKYLDGHETINKFLRKKYSPGFGSNKKVWQDSQPNGNIIDNIVAAETLNSEGKIVNILDNLKNTDDQYLFCDANKGSPNEKITYQSKPIWYFELKCDFDGKVDDRLIMSFIDKNESINVEFWTKSDENGNKVYDVEKNLEWLVPNIYQYNKYGK